MSDPFFGNHKENHNLSYFDIYIYIYISTHTSTLNIKPKEARIKLAEKVMFKTPKANIVIGILQEKHEVPASMQWGLHGANEWAVWVWFVESVPSIGFKVVFSEGTLVGGCSKLETHSFPSQLKHNLASHTLSLSTQIFPGQ